MSKNQSKIIILSILGVIALGLIAYANSLNIDFIWDDYYLAKDNIYIKSPSYIPQIFSQNIAAGAGKKMHAYRPVQTLTYLADYAFWKLNVKGYHLTNILLHILVALSIFWLINLLFKDQLVALFTSALFVVHPIHTEAVAYISGRADPLALVLMLLCFILYLKQTNPAIYILMLVSYALSLLSRESSLILPALILLYHYSFKKQIKTRAFLPILMLSLLYWILRVTALKQLLTHPGAPTTILQRLPGFFVAVTNYIRLLFLPFGLHMEYGIKTFAFTDPQAILGLLIISSLLIYAFRKRKTQALTFFALCWFLLALLPSSNIYPINAYMAEHWLYLPSIGFFLLLAYGFSRLIRLKQFKTLALIAIIFLASFYSYLTIRQNSLWAQPIPFYERLLTYNPESTRAYNNLGVTYRQMKQGEQAIPFYEKALEVDPRNVEAYYNLGNVYKDLGQIDRSIPLYEKAIEIDPKHAQAYYNFANMHDDLGNFEEAVALYKKALEADPVFDEAYNNLGYLYGQNGDFDQAIPLFKKAIQIDPSNIMAYVNLATTYNYLGNSDQAIPLYKQAIAIDPSFAEAYNNLATTYRSMGKTEEAIRFYKKAIAIKPNFLEPYDNLGSIYGQAGKFEQMIPLYKKVIDRDPTSAQAYYNLSVVYLRLEQYQLAIEYCDQAYALGLTNRSLLDALEPYRQDK